MAKCMQCGGMSKATKMKKGGVKLRKAQDGLQTIGNESKREKNMGVLKNVGTFLGIGAGVGSLALGKDIRSALARAKTRRATKKELKQEIKESKKLAKNK